MMLETILNFSIFILTLLFVGFFLLREVIKRWRIGLRISAGDESLLTDSSVSMKTITDAPQGSVIVPHVPAQIIDDGQ
tara:strand:- start:336 stop:569 length:234 start_codon:yes stop_codon:yes gene_type:complete